MPNEPLRLVDLSRSHAPLRAAIDEAIASVVDRTAFILGEEVRRFEAAFAEAVGVGHAIGLDNGTSALELILRGLGIGPGDEVIVPAMTFVATASAVTMTGAKPVFADVSAAEWTLDPEQVKAKRTSRTKAVLPVHFHGLPARMDDLAKAAGAGVVVLEDACQAHGARIGDRVVGSIGRAAAFSFYPSKNLGGFGDGGMVTTSDGDLAETIRQLRNYGERKKYEHIRLAYNRRLDTLQAAVLLVKLPHLETWNDHRRKAAGWYHAALQGTSAVLPPDPAGVTHSRYLYGIRHPKRDALMAALKSAGIDSGIHYPYPLHLLPVFAPLGHKAGDFPVAEALGRELLSLPLFPGITEAEVGLVAEAIKTFDRSGAR